MRAHCVWFVFLVSVMCAWWVICERSRDMCPSSFDCIAGGGVAVRQAHTCLYIYINVMFNSPLHIAHIYSHICYPFRFIKKVFFSIRKKVFFRPPAILGQRRDICIGLRVKAASTKQLKRRGIKSDRTILLVGITNHLLNLSGL